MKNLGLHLYSICVAVATLCLIVSGAVVANQDGAFETWHRVIGALVAALLLGLAVWLAVTKTDEWLRRLGRAAKLHQTQRRSETSQTHRPLSRCLYRRGRRDP